MSVEQDVPYTFLCCSSQVVREIWEGGKTVLSFDWEESVGYWVCTTSHAIRRTLEAELAKENITLRQWEVLAWIAVHGEPSQTQIADCLGIEPPTLAGVISRMERDGWLERNCCPDDRRRKRLKATPQAEAVWNRTVECCQRVRRQATNGISPDDLATFRRVCQQVRTNLNDDCSTGCSDDVTSKAVPVAKSS